MGDQFVDLVMIAVEAKRRRESSASYISISELRKDAIRTFAEEQHRSGRFKNMMSAEKTLHDACMRRLKPDVRFIEDFDELLDEWLRGQSNRLADVLYRHARTEVHRGLIRAFFDAAPQA